PVPVDPVAASSARDGCAPSWPRLGEQGAAVGGPPLVAPVMGPALGTGPGGSPPSGGDRETVAPVSTREAALGVLPTVRPVAPGTRVQLLLPAVVVYRE